MVTVTTHNGIKATDILNKVADKARKNVEQYGGELFFDLGFDGAWEMHLKSNNKQGSFVVYKEVEEGIAVWAYATENSLSPSEATMHPEQVEESIYTYLDVMVLGSKPSERTLAATRRKRDTLSKKKGFTGTNRTAKKKKRK